jgi:hypothetical protein
MNLVECKCGTLFYVEAGNKAFKCTNCKKKIVIKEKKAPSPATVESNDRVENSATKMSKWIFLLGSTVGIFIFALMIPTAIIFKSEPTALVIFLMIEVVFGTLLVCASISFYLLTLQVKNLQSLMNFHQHNLHIFADQISKLFYLLRKRD